MRIVNVKTAYFEPTIAEADFAQTSVGDPVQVRSDALPGKVYLGKVAAVYPAATTGTRTFSLRVNIPNPRNELRPGMFARGALLTEEHRNVVLVPVTALVRAQPERPGRQHEQHGDRVGRHDPAAAAGAGGGAGQQGGGEDRHGGHRRQQRGGDHQRPPAGDRLITTGQGIVQPGQPVKVEKPGADQTADAAGANG